MTVSDNDFLDLQDRFNALKLTVDTLLQNLLNPALITPGTLRFGSNVMELSHKGIVSIAKDSGDFLAESPNTNIAKWLKDGFGGTPLTEVFGGYTSPGGLTIPQLVLRALIDNVDFSAVNIGVWSESTTSWLPRFQIINGSTGTKMLMDTGVYSSPTRIMEFNRVDDDNYNLKIRVGGALVELISTANTSWVDLTDGGATTLHTHSGGDTWIAFPI